MEKAPDKTVERKIKEEGRQMKQFVCFGEELSLFAAMEKAPAAEKEGARGSRASPGARPQREAAKREKTQGQGMVQPPREPGRLGPR